MRLSAKSRCSKPRDFSFLGFQKYLVILSQTQLYYRNTRIMDEDLTMDYLMQGVEAGLGKFSFGGWAFYKGVS